MAHLAGSPLDTSTGSATTGLDWSAKLARRTRFRHDLLGGILALANARGVTDFSGGFPDPALFPTNVLHDLARALLGQDAAVALQYAPSQGIESTRDAIAELLRANDGARPSDDELMLTSGGIDAITLIAKSMLDPGDIVLVEQPSYLGALSGFAAFDAHLRGVAMDDEGLDPDALASQLATASSVPKLLYTIPDFQNPSGRTLSVPRRTALVELCRRYGVLVVEDVAYRQLGFDDTYRPSLWSLGPDVVVQIGTFSKTFVPGVRLGWAAGPSRLITELTVAKQNSDQCAAALGQRLLEQFLREGHFDAQLPRARELYRARGTALMAALTKHFAGLGTWTVPHGGFFSWLHLPGVNTTTLAEQARAVNVAFVPGAGFFAERADHEYLRLSYSRISEPDIDPGIAALATAVRSAQH